ncbi:MAG: Wzz/FepE/Etk N-terminal domain-containing protein, partial [Pirellulaceae bacterium]
MLQAAANSMGMGDSSMAQQGQPDLIQMLWRWKWLTLLGSLLGIGVGYLFFLQIAPTYKAMATLQIISPQDDLLPLRSLETGLTTGAGNRADEIRVITSSAVLSNAVEIGRLNQASALAGMEKEEIVNWIREARKLRANPGTKEMQTSIIDISFECEDPELSADVVRAVVAGYEAFLG